MKQEEAPFSIGESLDTYWKGFHSKLKNFNEGLDKLDKRIKKAITRLNKLNKCTTCWGREKITVYASNSPIIGKLINHSKLKVEMECPCIKGLEDEETKTNL